MPVSVGLVFPPGWPLTPGGPHLAIPLLCGELRSIDTVLLDLNLSSPGGSAHISEDEARTALRRGETQELYRGAQAAGELGWEAPFKFEPTTGVVVDGPVADPEYVQEVVHTARYPGFLASQLEAVQQCDIVGISIATLAQLPHALMVARALRKAGSGATIVLGGNVVTRLGTSLALPWVRDLIDGLVVLQGEKPITEMVSRHERGNRDLSGIPNVIAWTDGRVSEGTAVPMAPAHFGSWDFRGLPTGTYWGANYLPVMLARGCYFGKCTFCSIPYGYGPRGWLGLDRPERVLERMVGDAERTGIRRFKFVEEALHPQGTAYLARLLIEGAPGIEFEGYARLDRPLLDDDVLSSLAEAGLKKLYLGVEMVPTHGRRAMGKNDAGDPLPLLTKLAWHGIKAHCFTIAGHPGTTAQESIETIRFALDHRDLIDTLDVFPFYFARHTSVPGIEVDSTRMKAWDLELPYVPTAARTLTQEEVAELGAALEDVVWSLAPQWVDPIYRMVSPWS